MLGFADVHARRRGVLWVGTVWCSTCSGRCSLASPELTLFQVCALFACRPGRLQCAGCQCCMTRLCRVIGHDQAAAPISRDRFVQCRSISAPDSVETRPILPDLVGSKTSRRRGLWHNLTRCDGMWYPQCGMRVCGNAGREIFSEKHLLACGAGTIWRARDTKMAHSSWPQAAARSRMRLTLCLSKRGSPRCKAPRTARSLARVPKRDPPTEQERIVYTVLALPAFFTC